MRILIAIQGEDVAPRFDLATEVCIAEVENGALRNEPRIMLLPVASGDELCALILRETVTMVICGAIEEAHYQYLIWKKVTVIDGIIGPYRLALQWIGNGRLRPGNILSVKGSALP